MSRTIPLREPSLNCPIALILLSICMIAGVLRSAIAQLDLKFKALHIQKGGVLVGTQIAAAYIDLSSGSLSLFSNGGCRAAVASTDDSDCLFISDEVGRSLPASAQPEQQKTSSAARTKGGVAHSEFSTVSVPISFDMDHIILGSSGLWCATHASFFAQLFLRCCETHSPSCKSERFALWRSHAT